MNDLPVFSTPTTSSKPVKSLVGFLETAGSWHDQHVGKNAGLLSDLWYRGVNHHFDTQAPGVYRDNFTVRAQKLARSGGTERSRLHLERTMISQFRTAGAAFLDKFSRTQLYFVAQHFGMPTRLLDWSTNPLASLFFACDGKERTDDGYVYAMNAKEVIPKGMKKPDGTPLYQSVMTMRHPHVEHAVNMAFWEEPSPKFDPYILPVRPDSLPGRIGQQSSCFTFHMHGAKAPDQCELFAIRIDKDHKATIRDELHRVNVNQYTTYFDLDHLSKEIKRAWEIL